MKTRLPRVSRYAVADVSCCVLAAMLSFASSGAAVAQEEAAAADQPSPELEAAFKEMLDGATLAGHFTVTGRDQSNLREERYNIQSVEKLANDKWVFRAQIRYGDHNVTVPLALTVKWAGDTPMIVVDDLTIPALGTFDARVMFFKDHYAGYWRHGEVGGHLFGVIERDEEGDEEVDEEDE